MGCINLSFLLFSRFTTWKWTVLFLKQLSPLFRNLNIPHFKDPFYRFQFVAFLVLINHNGNLLTDIQYPPDIFQINFFLNFIKITGKVQVLLIKFFDVTQVFLFDKNKQSFVELKFAFRLFENERVKDSISLL